MTMNLILGYSRLEFPFDMSLRFDWTPHLWQGKSTHPQRVTSTNVPNSRFRGNVVLPICPTNREGTYFPGSRESIPSYYVYDERASSTTAEDLLGHTAVGHVRCKSLVGAYT